MSAVRRFQKTTVLSAIKCPKYNTTLEQHPNLQKVMQMSAPRIRDGQPKLVSIHIEQFLHAADWDTEHNHIKKLLKVWRVLERGSTVSINHDIKCANTFSTLPSYCTSNCMASPLDSAKNSCTWFHSSMTQTHQTAASKQEIILSPNNGLCDSISKVTKNDHA